MTDLAYLVDGDAAYARQFTAKVTALPPGGVVLDRTFFYPVGGGQPADHGSLARPNGPTLPVVDVTKSGAAVVHRVRRPAPGGPLTWKAGDAVEGLLDWDRRYRHMRLHTSQHFLSALIFQRTGVRTQQAMMSGAGGTIDLERPMTPEFRPEALAAEANAILREGRRVSIRHVGRQEWEQNPSPRSGLVSLPRNVDPVRIVEIAGLDACPCGGTHVRSTLEVGDIALDLAVPIALGGVRVPFRLVDAMPPTRSG